MWKVFSCPRCGGCVVVDNSKVACPFPGCRRPYALLKLVANGRAIVLDKGTVVIGRDDRCGSMKVSKRHAIFHRIGPDVRLEPVGSNGTKRWNGNRWVTLAGQPLVNAGDRLRLADVEGQILQLT